MRKGSTLRRLCATTVTAVALLAVPATAMAASSDSPPDTNVINSNDLDLSTPSDLSLTPLDPNPGSVLALAREPEGCQNKHVPIIPYPQICVGTSAQDGAAGEATARSRANSELALWEINYNVNCNGLPDLYSTLPRSNGTQFNIYTVCYSRGTGDTPVPEPQPGTDVCPAPVVFGEPVTCPVDPPLPPVTSADDCQLFPTPDDLFTCPDEPS